jgi:hypothetical protein
MDSELILPPMIAFTVAVFFAWFLPRFSRNFLGHAVILLTVIGCVIYVNQAGRVPSDAWGPAALIIALYIGGVGVVAGLILLIVGAIRARGIGPAVSPASYPYSKERPYKLPAPGLLTPARVFILIVLVEVVFCLFVFL